MGGTPRNSEAPVRNPEYLRKQAQKCRRLASQLTNTQVAGELLELAAEYEAEAHAFFGDSQMQAGDQPDDDDSNGRQQQG
jgi:hypothetical protein